MKKKGESEPLMVIVFTLVPKEESEGNDGGEKKGEEKKGEENDDVD
jgi:hypothetical protein